MFSLSSISHFMAFTFILGYSLMDISFHDQGSHKNTLIIGPIGILCVSTNNNEVIHRIHYVNNVFIRLILERCQPMPKIVTKQ